MFVGTETLPIEQKKVAGIKEQFEKFELQLDCFKKDLDLLQETNENSEISHVQRKLEECDRWLEYGPHTNNELQVSSAHPALSNCS